MSVVDDYHPPEDFHLPSSAFGFKQMQQIFERCLFTTMYKDLRNIALKAYGRVSPIEYPADRVEKALHALEDRSAAWIAFPQEAAMQDAKKTIHEFIRDIRDILPPISHAADQLAAHLYTAQDGNTLAAMYFEHLKKDLEHGLHAAEQFLQHGEIVIETTQGALKRDGVFGLHAKTPTESHMLFLHSMLSCETGFISDSKAALQHVFLPPEAVDVFVKKLATLALLVKTFAQAAGSSQKEELKRQTALRMIAGIAPDICGYIAQISHKSDAMPTNLQVHVSILEIFAANLAAITPARGINNS